MLETTVHSLVIARALLEQSEPLCLSEDRYLASAGLVILQDVIETVFYALLIELGIDEYKNMERKSFDELIGELKIAGVRVPKSGTLKALNKQRVLTKHYAQVAEPVTVRTYFDAARIAIDSAMEKVLGRTLRNLFISDLLQECESKNFLKTSEKSIQEGRFLDSLIETRKAVYVEFEEDYNVYGWRDYDGKRMEGMLGSIIRGGWRAPSWTQHKEWIEQHVKVPTDYIQIDYPNWRIQAMELGIHTAELNNLRQLTPDVFRSDRKAKWSVTYGASFAASNATEANARYCLDRAVSVVLKKQQHAGMRREPAKDIAFNPPPIYLGRVVYEQPTTDARQVHIVSQGFTYTIRRIVGGFNPEQTFYEVWAESEERSEQSMLDAAAHFFQGYLQILPDDA